MELSYRLVLMILLCNATTFIIIITIMLVSISMKEEIEYRSFGGIAIDGTITAADTVCM